MQKKLLQNGAMGYVTKNSSKEEMIDAIMEVSDGHTYICNEIKTILAYQQLEDNNAPRESEFAHTARNGYSIAD
ncbi:MAG: hypothetical protein WDO19_13700 [Bacteroidota bacterium]